MLTEREVLRRAAEESPDDRAPRLVYADWLQENGEERKAGLIRFCDAAEQLLAGIPDDAGDGRSHQCVPAKLRRHPQARPLVLLAAVHFCRRPGAREALARTPRYSKLGQARKSAQHVDWLATAGPRDTDPRDTDPPTYHPEPGDIEWIDDDVRPKFLDAIRNSVYGISTVDLVEIDTLVNTPVHAELSHTYLRHVVPGHPATPHRDLSARLSASDHIRTCIQILYSNLYDPIGYVLSTNADLWFNRVWDAATTAGLAAVDILNIDRDARGEELLPDTHCDGYQKYAWQQLAKLKPLP